MRFVIVGNGVAGITAAFKIRERDREAAITVISGESEYFFSRTALMYSFMDRLSLRDLEPYERRVYDQQRIARVGEWVVDLDAGAHVLTLRSGHKVPYDRLLLATGSSPNRVPWSGLEAAREGVVHFVSLQDLERCERLVPSTERAIVVGGGLIGVELVECLRFHGREVTFLILEPYYWPVALGGLEAGMISDHIRRHGVDLRLEEEVGEVLSDSSGRVTGVRTVKGNEYVGQLLGICIGVHPTIEWLRSVKTPPRIGRGIQVTPDFRTSLPDVWAAGDCAEIQPNGDHTFVEQIWYSAKRQGELAARAMLGDSVDYRPPIFFNSSKFFEIEYTTVGIVTRAPTGAVDFYSRLPGREVSIRVVEHEGAVIGFNMLGSRWNHNVLEAWIAERRNLDYVMKRLPEAQFDVEFGQQDLSSVLSDYAAYRRARS
ncbi:MAG: FAD/NAD(P)-binding oxidoreductase [Acidobacteriota bacterium]